MRRLTASIAGQTARINVLEGESDVDEFKDFVRRNPHLDFDTEGTGLDIFSRNYRLRLVQLGAGFDSYVLPVELGPRYAWLAAQALRFATSVTAHNLTYDALVADAHLGVPLEELFPKGFDTGIASRLLDSRAAHEGGHGHSLEDLVAHFIDPGVAAEIKGSVREMAKELKTTKAKFWSTVPINHKGYNLYAGMDTIFAGMLKKILLSKLPEKSKRLLNYEHELAMINAILTRKGYLLDLEYVEEKEKQLTMEQELYEREAANLGLENVNSPAQVGKALVKSGWHPEEFTDNGQPKVAKKALDALVKAGNPIADAVQKAKRANKWNEAYFRTFLTEADIDGRIHAFINTMAARTARYSITRPALQTLPSFDFMVRMAFLADEGSANAGIDYVNQELRVMAVRSGDLVMLDAFRNDKDLHQITADAASRAIGREIARSAGKTANFSKAFGGGAKAISDGAGLDIQTAQLLSKTFDETYRGVKAWNDELMGIARKQGYIENWIGRRLYVDKQRAYAALNYDTQGGAREITAQAQIRLHRAGYTDLMRLPVHDEIIFNLPIDTAEELAVELGHIMEAKMTGPGGDLMITTDPDIYGRSWGDGYVETRRPWRETYA